MMPTSALNELIQLLQNIYYLKDTSEQYNGNCVLKPHRSEGFLTKTASLTPFSGISLDNALPLYYLPFYYSTECYP